MKKLSILLVLVMLISVFASGCGGGAAQDENAPAKTIVLRLASDAPLEHIATGLNNEACELVKERTEGRVEIEYFPASQLGGYETVYEEIVRGTIDLAQITIPDALDARLGAAYVPYYAKSFDEAKVLYAPDSYLSGVIGDLTAANGVKFLGTVLEGFIGMAFVQEPTDIFTPGTNKNVKTRSPAMVTFSMAQQDLGFNPITVPYAEVPTAIQTKVVDGWVGGTPNINYAWVGEVINYMYVNYIHAEATSYVVSEKTLAKLTPEDAATVVAVFQEQSVKSFTLAQENEQVYKEKLAADYGVDVVEFTPEQVDAYATFVRETSWPKLEALLGKELMDGMRAEVAKL
ncbi:MAG: TRAP transporter substrate-binding protein DctP [Peptostreptococcaceae bacterium]|nr:TRAP transporter substrate-binding protein DctP [Peptostreptococcaceae bacterium]